MDNETTKRLYETTVEAMNALADVILECIEDAGKPSEEGGNGLDNQYRRKLLQAFVALEHVKQGL